MSNTKNKGYVGQLRGPFQPGVNIISLIGAVAGHSVRLGISVDPYDLMPYFDPGRNPLRFSIQYTSQGPSYTIELGKTGMYEMDTPTSIYRLTFLQEAPNSTLIEYAVGA